MDTGREVLDPALPLEELRAKMLEEGERRALLALPDAMDTLARAVSGDPKQIPGQEEIRAANVLVQHIMGRPGQKAAPAKDDHVSEFIRGVRDIRSRPAVVRTLPRRDGPLVEEAEDTLRPE